MSIKNRIARLVRAQADRRPPGRTVIVSPSEGPAEVPGSIEPTADPQSFRMYVAAADGLDPVAGLSPGQRAFLRDDDRVAVMPLGDDGGGLAAGVPGPKFPTWDQLRSGRDDWWKLT